MLGEGGERDRERERDEQLKAISTKTIMRNDQGTQEARCGETDFYVVLRIISMENSFFGFFKENLCLI